MAKAKVLNSRWFDEFRNNLYRNDYMAWVDYKDKHENTKSMVLFPKLRGCKTKKLEFIINYN